LNNLKFIDIHTHGAFGFDFNYANYEQIKIVLKKMYERNIKAICPTLVGESITNIQRQLEIFTRIKKNKLQIKKKKRL
jgi:N-acetylglucosamine-6-phosphate deacetylase